jgi:hypothetical protein
VKSTHKPIQKEHTAPQANSFSVEIHSDIWGPSPVQSIGGQNYYVTFTDDYLCYTHIELLCTKDEAFAAWASTQHGANIKHFRSDHSSEFTSQAFNAFLKEQGTKCQLTTHDTPQHNGMAKSLNHCLMEHVHTLLYSSRLPKFLWGEAIHFAVWLKNHTLTRALSNITPYKHLHRDKPNLA